MAWVMTDVEVNSTVDMQLSHVTSHGAVLHTGAHEIIRPKTRGLKKGAGELMVTMTSDMKSAVPPDNAVPADDAVPPDRVHKCIHANIRDLREGSRELSATVELHKPHFIFLTDCHIAKGGTINMWIPHGYKVVIKRWRSKHSGGLLVLAQDRLLCDAIDFKVLDKYHINETSELIGM